VGTGAVVVDEIDAAAPAVVVDCDTLAARWGVDPDRIRATATNVPAPTNRMATISSATSLEPARAGAACFGT
jgi:hypothetical protein